MSFSESAEDRNQELMDRARAVMPGGVNSPVRSFLSVGGVPRFIHSALGAQVQDANGRRYLDFVGSWGVALLGHAPADVVAAAREAVGRGASFGAPTQAEVELAELVTAWLPGFEVMRLVNSGTEATMSALRLARAVTERSGVIKFRGGYHGHADSFLVAAGSGAATFGTPSSPGVPDVVAQHTAVVEYNDLAGVEAVFEARPGEIAAIIVEPVSGNMGCVPPLPGFLEGLRELCTEQGAVLIFDEVMTGFRVGPKGARGVYGVEADLVTLGKVLGGGFPLAAYGGREELMRRVAPDGDVYQAGTLSGNPVGVAAGLATMRRITSDPGVYEHLESLGVLLDDGMATIIERSSLPLCWNRVGAMGSLFFSQGPVTDWTSASVGVEGFSGFFHSMLNQGIHLPPSGYEAWFWSTAHSSADIERTLEAVDIALREVVL